jgi:hypothetical protein
MISPELSTPVVERRGSFAIGSLLVQTCESCGNKIILDAGDVIFGGRWYHAACWQLADGDSRGSESHK